MKPKGFWSYARMDDEHLDGRVSELRKRVAGEIGMLLGHGVEIFQDIKDLRTGDKWADRLRAELNGASFLIPVLTPTFFNRDWCRDEVLTFLEVAKAAGLEPRIYPIRFVEWDDDPGCAVRDALGPFQYKDFSNWRFESDPTRRDRLLNEFAKDVKDKLKLPLAASRTVSKAPTRRQKRVVVEKAEALAKASPEAIGQSDQAAAAPVAAAQKYRIHVVDPFPKRGDFTSIQKAIDSAEPGDRIIVREGTYRESLFLSKPLEIFGEGDREKILIVAEDRDTLQSDAPMGRIAGMRFRREERGKDYAIWIHGGAIEIEDCIVESQSLSAIEVRGSSTRPTLRRCVVRGGVSGGLYVHTAAQLVIEECEFFGNASSSIQVMGEGTRVVARRSIIESGKGSGFSVYDGARSELIGCELRGNLYSGVAVWSGASVLLTDCIVSKNKGGGLSVYEGGKGQMIGGQVLGNDLAGILVDSGGEVLLEQVKVAGNNGEAVWISGAGSSGQFFGNDLRGNERGAWDIAEGAEVVRKANQE